MVGAVTAEVEASACDVGGDEDGEFAAAEVTQHTLALLLTHRCGPTPSQHGQRGSLGQEGSAERRRTGGHLRASVVVLAQGGLDKLHGLDPVAEDQHARLGAGAARLLLLPQLPCVPNTRS